ncbi:ABC transporter permease [bacterium]|nr:ABC transporter permease [candidate division CSSED10-310 bacterium]
MAKLGCDVAYGGRMLVRHPVLMATAIGCLGVGIGVCATLFTIIATLLFHPLPFRNPGELIWLHESNPDLQKSIMSVSYLNFLDWQREQAVFESIAVFTSQDMNVEGPMGTERLVAGLVSAEFFEVLGVLPVRGDLLENGHFQPGTEPSAVISWNMYRRLSRDSGIRIGDSIRLGGVEHTIIGIMPERFELPARADVWIPLMLDVDVLPRDTRFLWGIGRLDSGIDMRTASMELNRIARSLQEKYPEENSGVEIRIRPIRELFVQTSRQALAVLAGVALFVLITACVNVANLLLSRGSFRQREYALRMAFGASRGRLLKQLLSESVVLGLGSGITGLLICMWGVDFLVPSLFAVAPRFLNFEVNGEIVLLTMVGALVSGLVTGTTPILQIHQKRLHEVLKEGGGIVSPEHNGRRHIRNVLVTLEIALAFVLLAIAGYNFKGYRTLKRVDPGIRIDRLLTMQFHLPESQYARPDQTIDFLKLVMLRVEMIPGVESAGVNQQLPLRARLGWEVEYTVANQRPGEQNPHANYQVVGPNYFRTMGIDLIAGRSFEYGDNQYEEPVAIISREFADRYWARPELALNAHVKLSGSDSDDPWLRIVGVCRNVRHRGVDRDVMMDIYVPCLQQPLPGMTLVVRTAHDPERWIEPVRKAVHAVDRNVPVFNIMTMEQVYTKSLDEPRIFTILSIVSAAVSLILASVSILGTLMYSVNRKYHEIGVRKAMGAQQHRIMLQYSLEAGRLIISGTIGGALGMAAIFAWIPHPIICTGSIDWEVFLGTLLIMVMTGMLASALPVWRACHIAPVDVLRYE